MYPMRNMHTNIVCRGLHELRKEMRARKFKAVYKNDRWQLEEDKK